MDPTQRVDDAIRRHLAGRTAPPHLGAAITDALFPGGARVRPKFAMGVAFACGDDRPKVSDALAVAIEFLHCASLTHDDLPCFDDAPLRRGKPSVHAKFGEAAAVLVGDALIVMAFQALADVGDDAADRLPALLSTVAACAGTPDGLVGGQAMEAEPSFDLAAYHRAKTGVLFEAAAAGAAIACGADPAPWRNVGAGLGAAYQLADDIHDHVGDGSHGKPAGQDARHARPNAVDLYGLQGAVGRLREVIETTASSIPDSPTSDYLAALVREQVGRFLPAGLADMTPA